MYILFLSLALLVLFPTKECVNQAVGVAHPAAHDTFFPPTVSHFFPTKITFPPDPPFFSHLSNYCGPGPDKTRGPGPNLS